MDHYQLLKLLETESQTVEFCIRLGLLPDREPGDCIYCHAKKTCFWTRDKRGKFVPYVIRCKRCHRSHSIAKNTFFEHSKTPIKNVLMLVYAFLRGLTLSQTALEIGVSRTTVMSWQSFCREVCFLRVSRELQPIGGKGRTVEIDHMLVRKLKLNPKVWVFGAIDRETKECFAEIIESKTKETIRALVIRFILPGTTIISYKKALYSNLEKLGYKTKQICIKRTLSDTKNKKKSQMVEIPLMWDELRKIIRNNGRDCSRNNGLYIYQFLYFHRFGLNTAADRFLPFLKDIAHSYPGYKFKAFSKELEN